MFPRINPTTTQAWSKLSAHYQQLSDQTLKDIFKSRKEDLSTFTRSLGDIHVDFSKNHITSETLTLLLSLAEETGVTDAILAMRQGETINEREERAVLHSALRSNDDSIVVDGENVIPQVKEQLERVNKISSQLRSGEWTGYTGKPIKCIVNIGIGGSDLGPQMVCNALRSHWEGITPFFLSNVDGAHWEEIKGQINPEETFFIIASKTFTTDETMTNARTARKWFLENANDENFIAKHFAAVSTNLEQVGEFGIPETNVVGFWNWVGGRFSLWSSIGLSIACTIGYDKFSELLNGAAEADSHLFNADLKDNIPVILALITIWQVNFQGWKSKTVLPYDQNLKDFPRFLQQLIMESNGKQVDRNGNRIDYSTCPVYFGESGTNGQHAFYQLLHQGTEIIPADFIVAAKPNHDLQEHHDKLLANCFAQSEALMDGNKNDDIYRNFEGNRPSNTLILKQVTPKTLGSLIALYEHQVFIQGVIWNIYSFDQWGVELGKVLAKKIASGDEKSTNSSTNHLLSLVDQLVAKA